MDLNMPLLERFHEADRGIATSQELLNIAISELGYVVGSGANTCPKCKHRDARNPPVRERIRLKVSECLCLRLDFQKHGHRVEASRTIKIPTSATEQRSPSRRSQIHGVSEYLEYNLVGQICMQGINHFVAAWCETVDGRLRCFFYDGTGPMTGGPGNGDNNKSSRKGLAVELLDHTLPCPARYDPVVMLYERKPMKKLPLDWNVGAE